MSERKAFLEKVHVKNFLSLRNVTLPFKPLTVLVGPNASGKSNVLRALRLLRAMTQEARLSTEFIRDRLWAGASNHITFQLQAEVEGSQIIYDLVLKIDTDKLLFDEELSVNDIKISSVLNQKYEARTEDEKNEGTNTSEKITLKSLDSHKERSPISNSVLREFIKTWEFYDFQPGHMRDRPPGLDPEYLKMSVAPNKQISILSLSSEQMTEISNTRFHIGIQAVLSSWYKDDRERFDRVSESLAASVNFKMDFNEIDGRSQLCLLEGYKNPISLQKASEGTLRLIAYYTLLHQDELPPLITIEEPERNLHPGALTDIAYVLECLAERTQVVITTHSSQLLDNFKSESLSNSLGVLLLRNRPGLGTEVLNVENIRDKRESLAGWIADFGIGSAVFNTGLLQDLMEEPI
ncbi:MAG: ATP-binding protein [Candidatus Poribacteria bacterium]|nr:ATP-binding protein [Candidatus Poribacteria bacterium]